MRGSVWVELLLFYSPRLFNCIFFCKFISLKSTGFAWSKLNFQSIFSPYFWNTRNVTCKLKKKRIFGTRNANDKKDFSIRVYDHEYGGDLDGLSEKTKILALQHTFNSIRITQRIAGNCKHLKKYRKRIWRQQAESLKFTFCSSVEICILVQGFCFGFAHHRQATKLW